MQPDDLKAARGEMGMTQGNLAEALGLTPQFIGMMERGEKPIERRTALAVRQLYNSTTPLYGEREEELQPGDVPLADAMIVWEHDNSDVRPRIKVVGPGQDDRRYAASYGACNADWKYADAVGQLLRLLSRIPEWTLLEGIPPREVHDALWVIPEYRAAVAYQFAIDKERDD